MRIVAVIPVKQKSDRVENKNFREFADGFSLIEIKSIHL
jgi:CMP-N-acetylneuraminic acid synthetase